MAFMRWVMVALLGCIAGVACGGESVGRSNQPIVGGTATSAWPAVGRVRTELVGGAVSYCTGTLIALRYVLTAAHCFHYDHTASNFVIINKSGIEQTTPIVEFRMLGLKTKHHSQQTLDGYSADLAVARLGSYIFPADADAIPIADRWPTAADSSVRVGYGWDSRDESGTSGVKRFLGFSGSRSNMARNGDSGGPAMFAAGAGAVGIWGVASKKGQSQFIFDAWVLDEWDVDVNAVYFKEQVIETIHQWEAGEEPGIDRPGGDYETFAVNNTDACRLACGSEPRCRAWTWLADTCHLKRIIPTWQPNANATTGLNANRWGSGYDPPLGWDRPGGDYRAFTVTNLADCARECAKDEICRTFTAEAVSRGYWCILKNTQAAPVPRAAKRSEVKRGLEMDTDRPGSDYRQFDVGAHAPERCQAECAKDNRCRAWSFVLAGPVTSARCYLKSNVPATTRTLGIISGRRQFEFY